MSDCSTVVLYPVLQSMGVVPLVNEGALGFGLVSVHALQGLFQELIFRFSQLEMDLVSVERLMEC